MKFLVSTFVYFLVSLTAVAGSAELPTVSVTHRAVEGIGATPNVMRRDPSDIIRVDDTYYVWYSRGKISPGYDANVWYATSSDGVHWTEQGQALAKGTPGDWDGASVFTPNILVAEGRYWLFYTGTSRKFQKGFNPDSKIGVAVSESPDGPWSRVGDGPVVTNSEHKKDFDSHLVDDACLVAREGKYWLYYKGRQLGKGPGQTQMGVAVAKDPQGPYVKHAANPVIPGNHEVLVWPQGGGVAAMIGTTGPKEITNSIMYAADRIRFTKTHRVISGPWAGGVYRADDFQMDYAGGPPRWGIEIGRPVKGGATRLPFLQRFEIPEASQQSMR
ncbi:family 43 glycosylhydrolase [Crateriforma conspicua]|uniref:Glycosyl hydrolases family 43 n=1 Tax=Crateriforma conspicua TaxID=2527996 RepID=A0A5C5Y988_9PLAN|nr:Glycosyl hydrolases family 43 [Crateriforma conspicua]